MQVRRATGQLVLIQWPSLHHCVSALKGIAQSVFSYHPGAGACGLIFAVIFAVISKGLSLYFKEYPIV
jgi:hypothetical protein